MADLPQQGESLPDLELTTESGEHIGTGELTGQRTVLYFYPRDDSLDSPESHHTFREKYGLNFPLLTDEEGRASEALGVLGERGKARRVTFLLDPEGRISKVYPEVSPQTHAEEILEDAASL
jgi:peroxiredoxin Q/BCP